MKTFNRLKIWKLNYSLFIICLLSFQILFQGCGKEELKSENVSSQLLSNRSNDISVENGMLAFKNPWVVQQLVTQLKASEDTQSERDVLYNELNITTEIDDFYTDHPGCLKFEEEIGYVSLRTSEEAELFQILENGTEGVNSIISFPYRKTILNEDRAFKVGNRIFKFFESGLTVMITNSDFNKLTEINGLSEDEIFEEFNVRVGNKNGDIADNYYSFNSSGQPTSTIFNKDFRVDQFLRTDDFIEIKNNSFIEYSDGSNPTFEWKYSDGTSSNGQNPDRFFSEGDSLIVIFGNPNNGFDTTTVYPRLCSVGEFPITFLGGNRFRFGSSGPIVYSAHTPRWILGDGTIIDNEHVVEHTYSASSFNGSPLPVTFQLLRPDGTVACQRTQLLPPPDCDLEGSRSDEQIFNNIGGEDWKIDCKIWVEDGTWFTSGDVGSRTKSLRKGLFGIFYARKAQTVTVGLQGFYLDASCNVVTEPHSEESETNSGNVQRNRTNVNNPQKYPDQLKSNHKMKVNNIDCIYTKNSGFLVLN